jgi:hypothetical protein
MTPNKNSLKMATLSFRTAFIKPNLLAFCSKKAFFDKTKFIFLAKNWKSKW